MRSVVFRVPGVIAAGALACVLSGEASAVNGAPPAGVSESVSHGTQIAVGASEEAFNIFLDRLMQAESNGRNNAKNPLSSALGPFQFIKSTFLEVMRRHFPDDIAHLSERDILALRTDHGFARRAAEAFSRDNLDYLLDKGLQPTFGHLRLAFLLGPSAAARVMQAPPSKPLHQILDGSVIAANPFMRRMTAGDLIARATRDVSPREPARTQIASAKPAAAEPSQPAAAQDDAAARAAAPQPARVAEAAPETASQPQPARVADVAPEAATQPQQPAEVTAVAPDAAKAHEPAKPADAGAKPRPAPAAVAQSVYGTTRVSGGTLVIDVKCNDKLPSCRRWIDEQVARLSKVAAVPGRRGA